MLNFKRYLLAETGILQTYLSQASEDVTDIATIRIMADALEDSEDPENIRIAELIRLAHDYFTNWNEKIGDRLLPLLQEFRSELFKQGIIASNTEVRDRRVEDKTTIYTLWGNHVRKTTVPHAKKEIISINIRDIEDPLILRGLAICYAEILFYGKSQSAGLPEPFTTRERLRKDWYQKGREYRSHDNDQLLRTYLQGFFRHIYNCEKLLFDIDRLQRNGRQRQELYWVINREQDDDAIVVTIQKHKYSSPFLIELVPRLNRLIEQLQDFAYNDSSRFVSLLRKVIEAINNNKDLSK
jgi:hypothetical protein